MIWIFLDLFAYFVVYSNLDLLDPHVAVGLMSIASFFFGALYGLTISKDC